MPKVFEDMVDAVVVDGCGNQTELQRAFFEDRYDTSDTIDTEFERWVLTQLGR